MASRVEKFCEEYVEGTHSYHAVRKKGGVYEYFSAKWGYWAEMYMSAPATKEEVAERIREFFCEEYGTFHVVTFSGKTKTCTTYETNPHPKTGKFVATAVEVEKEVWPEWTAPEPVSCKECGR